MPQLDTVYTLTTYLWAWFMLHMMAQKIKTFLMTTHLQKNPSPNKPTPPLPWL